MTEQLPPWAESEVTAAELMDEERAESWHIRSDSEAEWAMAHVAAASDQMSAIQDQYDLWRQQLDQWLTSSLREPQRTADFFTGHLRQYGIQIRVQSGDKVKSLKLASGEIKTTKAAAKVIVIDDDKVITWAEDNGFPEVVKVAKSVLLTPLRQIAAIEDLGDGEYRVVHHETGTPIPGVDVEPETVSASPKPRPPLQRGVPVHALVPSDV